MSTVSAPYGLRYAEMGFSRPAGGASGIEQIRIKSGYTGVIPYGAPVMMSQADVPTGAFGAGYITNVTAGTLITTGSTKDYYAGVFTGASYNLPGTSQPAWDQWYPGSITAPTGTTMMAYVITDVEAIFKIQALGANFDALANIGLSYKLNIPGTPYNAGSKDSTISLDTAAGTDPAYPFKVVGLALTPDNTNASGYVDVLVKINSGFSLYTRAL